MPLRSSCKSLAIALLSLTIAACGATLGEYQRFANAGKSYAGAMDALLKTSADLFIEANSASLLDNDLQDPPRDREAYRDATANVETWLRLIEQARKHTNLLRKYFLALENLANSDAPERSRAAAEQIFTELNAVGALVRPSLLANPLIGDDASKAYSQIPRLILSHKIKGELRAEIQTRKEAIYSELVTQELTQKLLSRQIKKNLAILQAFRDKRTIKEEFIAPIPIANVQGWIERRTAIRKMTLSMEALESSQETSSKLREAFVELVDDRLTIARANALLDDINDLLSTVKDLQAANAANQ